MPTGGKLGLLYFHCFSLSLPSANPPISHFWQNGKSVSSTNFLADSWPRSIVSELTSQGRPPSASSALLLGTSGPRWQRPVPQCRRTMPWWNVVQCRRTMPTCRASFHPAPWGQLGRGARPPPSSSRSLHVIICDQRRLEGKPELIFVEICQDE